MSTQNALSAFMRATIVVCICQATLIAGTPPKQAQATIPVAFERNVGQAVFEDGRPATHVDGIVSVNGATAYIHPGGMHIVQQRVIATKESTRFYPEHDVEQFRVDIQLIASNPNPRLEFGIPAEGVVRYHTAGTPFGGLIADRFSLMTYRDVWPGIDMRTYLTVQGVKYDFLVRPGADASQIAFAYNGGSSPVLRQDGALHVTTPIGSLDENAPVVYEQLRNGLAGSNISAQYVISGQSVRFTLGDYDPHNVLVIDPQRIWATYYGGNKNIDLVRITADPQGNVIIAGTTAANNLPNVPGVMQRRLKAGLDGFVAKFNDAGKFLWHTYYGGSKTDRLNDVTTDASGHIWACGQSSSDDLPNLFVGSGPLGDPDSVQGSEAVVLKLTPDGAWADSWQVYGRLSEVATGIAVKSDRIAIVGHTRSPTLGGDFGVQPWRKDPFNSFNNTDMFVNVVRPKTLDPTKWTNHYVIFYGGSNEDFGGKIAFDKQGNVIFTGQTLSPFFPTTDLTTYRGNDDNVVVKFGPTPDRLWSTIYGSSNFDDTYDMVVDATDAIIVVGGTEGANFPVLNPYKATLTGISDGYIRKWNPDGTVQFSTFYGGDSGDVLRGVGVDRSNNIWAVGFTNRSLTIPVTADAILDRPYTLAGSDGIMAKLNPTGTTVLYGSYYGGPSQPVLPPFPGPNPPPPPPPPPNTDLGQDELTDVFCDNNAYVLLSGRAATYRFTPTPGAFQDSAGLDQDTTRWNGYVTFLSNCKDSSITAIVNGAPTICDNESRQLIAPTGFAKYRWSRGDTTRIITVSDSGTFVVTVTTLDGCRYRDTLSIGRNPKPIVRAGADTTICKNVITTLVATVSGGRLPYRYKWNRIESGPEFIDNDTVQSPGVTPGTTSRYEVTVTDSVGCSGKDTVLVTVVDPKPTFTPNRIDFGTLDPCATAAEANITINNPMTYEIRVSGFTSSDAGISIVTSLATPISIPVGGSTVLRFRYAPSASGLVNGSITLTGSPCAWTLPIPFQAVKQQLTASVIPGTISFGATVLCNLVPKIDSTVIRNGGSDDLNVMPGTITPGGVFTLVSPLGGFTISPQQQRVVVFQYLPAGAGASLSVATFPFSTGTCSDTLRVNLNAVASAVTVRASATSIDVGTLAGCDTERDTVFEVFNDSDVPITLTLPVLAEVIFTPAGPVSMQSKSSVTIRATVRPSATGPFSLNVTLTAEPCNVSVPITFTGSKQGIGFTTPPSIAFGEFSACIPSPSTTRTSSLTFEGTGSSTITSVSVGPRATTTLAGGQTLNAGQARAFDVTWTPIADGPLVDSIVVVFDPCNVRRVILLSGSRTSVSLRADNATVNLGAIAGNATGTLRFTNNGTDTLSVTTLAISTSSTILATRPVALNALLPGSQIEVDYRVACAGRTNTVDSISASVVSPCPMQALSILSGTCQASATNVTSTVTLDSVQVKTGDRFTVPLRLRASTGLQANNLTAWRATITYNPMVIVGGGGTTPDCFVAGQFAPCEIIVTGTRGQDTLGILANLSFTAILGDAVQTPLVLNSFEWIGATSETITRRDGHVLLTDICTEGGVRLLQGKAQGFSVRAYPIPASTEFTIELRGAGTDPISWQLSSSVGSTVASGSIQPDASGAGNATVDVRSYGAGVYVLTVTARGSTFRSSVLIQR